MTAAEMRDLAWQLRVFHDIVGDTVPMYKVQLLSTALLIDTCADRRDRSDRAAA